MRRRSAIYSGIVLASLVLVSSAFGQAAREDVIWARNASGPITLDGVLNESSWAQAEQMVIVYGQNAGDPGSGWKLEGGTANPDDPVTATLKFLVDGDELYLGAEVQDASVGGSDVFNRHDGFLMAIKDHGLDVAPKPVAEYLYSWWYPEGPTPLPPGYPPGFIGSWAPWPPGTPRDSTQIANWDAVTVVHGLANADSIPDTGYTIEMRFNLTCMGYDVTRPEGDVVEWNISIYDCDWLWPLVSNVSFKRVWWQSPWGNTAWYHQVQIHARPDVTVSSGPVPTVAPDLTIDESTAAVPVIDGDLSDAIWGDANTYTFDIRWDDDALRLTYPSVGPYRAGQYQPEVNGGTALVLDPADATVSVAFRDDMLYMAFDVDDQVVQYHPDFDRWDGFLVLVNEWEERGPDNQIQGRRLAFQVNADGTALPQEYLTTLIAANDAEVALDLKPGTTVDTLGTQADTGYTAELAIDLKGLGYPSGLSSGTLYLGVNHLDGDSFIPTTDSYGTRTWWFREYESECCPAWIFLDAGNTGVEEIASTAAQYGVVTTLANPSAEPRIRFSLPAESRVSLEIYDVAGRLVEIRELGIQPAGVRQIDFGGSNKAAGVYMYRLKLVDPETGALRSALNGKAVLIK
jgi:hypothetical protein